jgi:hypothetical protein
MDHGSSDAMEIVPGPNQESPLPLRPRSVEMEGIEENLAGISDMDPR